MNNDPLAPVERLLVEKVAQGLYGVKRSGWDALWGELSELERDYRLAEARRVLGEPTSEEVSW